METRIDLELKKFDERLTLKNYSKATRKAYGCALGQFLKWRIAKGYVNGLTQEQARQYILKRYDKGLKWQTINGDYSAIMKYFKYVQKMEWDVDHIPRPRKERRLPRILSQEDVIKIIEHAPNLKHQTFICLLYGTGIRLGEALNLKISDIDGKRKQLFIQGKGAKDRYVDIPDCLLDLMREYYRWYRPVRYFIQGKERGQPMHPRSAQHLIKEICKLAGIHKQVSPHTFRHCYATHHLENGSNLLFLQKQLGHKQLKTTAKYVHLVNDYSWHIHHPIANIALKYNPRRS